ncbi:MAG: hypothetical protein LBL59_06495, partial [Xanthomonadaceae bacterium]|nr:hypothetical protein [Xanthomonadaceae bacterium]
MNTTSQQYADLANKVYSNEYPPGIRGEDEAEILELSGITYKLLEYVNCSSGYQGMTFQKLDTGEIIVAHRGTEFGNQPIRDGLLADGGMVLGRYNWQAEDAIALTQRALDRASDIGKTSGHTPEVTSTGHSLGGGLSQIVSHHFGIKGETFNAYGAASLDRRVPEGGYDVINHVMAADFVSAASPHYGQVRVYATQEEIHKMR